MAYTLLEEQELFSRLSWFIRLRWLAATGVFFVILFIFSVLKLKLPYLYLYSSAGLILVYNTIFLIYQRSLLRKELQSSCKLAGRFANIQISIDLFSLALLIHFSGGIENPFTFYFIFHMIIASILLSVRASFFQATFAILLLTSVAGLEYFKIFPHYSLDNFIGTELYKNGGYLVGFIFVFTTTIYLSVYMATSISEKLRQRSKELVVANERLQEQDRLKNEYVYRVTHNIKAHLSAIESCLEPVIDGIVGVINDRQRDLIGRARSRTDKLLFFVKALLKLTQIRLAKEWPVEEISLIDVIKRALETVDSKAKQKDIKVTIEISENLPKIKANEIGIEEVFVDLLMNSVKYTPQSGKIDVNIKDLDKHILVEIKDSGIGISKDDLPKLFEEFFRANNAREIERDGTGLGLSIVKQIIERHSGKIWIESEGLGKGTKIKFILPKNF